MAFLDKLFGMPEHNDMPVASSPPPRDSSPFSDDAKYFGQRMMDKKSPLLLDICNECVRALSIDNQQWINSKMQGAKESYAIKRNIRLSMNASKTGLSFSVKDEKGNVSEYELITDSYRCTGVKLYKEYGYNDIPWSDNYKLYGLIYASLEIICPQLRQRMEGVHDICVNVWPTSEFGVEAVIDISLSAWVNKQLKEM